MAGCNLRCRYCDTAYAWEGGEERDTADIVAEARRASVHVVEITGGEPLLQEGFVALAEGLRDGVGCPVIVETNGSRDIRVVPDRVAAIVDMKCPGSGMHGKMDLENLRRLRPQDELKFVLADRRDYDYAREILREYRVDGVRTVLFSPVHGALEPARLAAWILEDGLPVRLQLPLHKLLWPGQVRGR